MNDAFTNNMKETYINHWAKAARNCQQVHNDLRRWFRDLIFPLGHGAISSKEEHAEHEAGEVDIFVQFGFVTLAGVEVTGSTNVDFPCEVWIGHHKIKYAKKQSFPIAYILFYKNAVRFVEAKTVQRRAPKAVLRRVYGNKEYYHVVDPDYTHPYSLLKNWIDVKRTAYLRKLGYL